MITAAELADLRVSVNEILAETAQVQRKAETEDVFGSAAIVWHTIATVACDINASPYHPTENPLPSEHDMAVARWLITLPAGTDITENDRLVIRGEIYEVISVMFRSIELYRRVLAETRR